MGCVAGCWVLPENSGGKYVFKVVMLGDYAVGKTCIVKRYVKNTFEEDYKASIGVDISSHVVELGENRVQLQIWDISGQTGFMSVRSQYLSATDCGAVVIDLTRQSSVDGIPRWIQEAHAKVPGLPLILVGNKADISEERVIAAKEGKKLAKKYGMFSYIETSARSGANVSSLFEEIARQSLRRLEKQ
jgi:small GTP-binding protein